MRKWGVESVGSKFTEKLKFLIDDDKRNVSHSRTENLLGRQHEEPVSLAGHVLSFFHFISLDRAEYVGNPLYLALQSPSDRSLSSHTPISVCSLLERKTHVIVFEAFAHIMHACVVDI